MSHSSDRVDFAVERELVSGLYSLILPAITRFVSEGELPVYRSKGIFWKQHLLLLLFLPATSLASFPSSSPPLLSAGFVSKCFTSAGFVVVGFVFAGFVSAGFVFDGSCLATFGLPALLFPPHPPLRFPLLGIETTVLVTLYSPSLCPNMVFCEWSFGSLVISKIH